MLLAFFAFLTFLGFGCDVPDTYITYETNNTYVNADTDTAAPTEVDTDTGIDTASEVDTGPDLYLGAPTPNTLPADMTIDIFGTDGNVLYSSVVPEQVVKMNDNWLNESWDWGYMYEIGDDSDVTYASDLIVVEQASCFDFEQCFDPPDFSACNVASYGKVEEHTAGQSTGVTWDATTIPNFAMDMDEFQDDLSLNGTEYLRFNNGQVGSIYREAITLQIFRELGYPAPRTSFNWLMSNVWPEGTMVPYTTVQPYKRDWCDANADKLGGGCANIWEGVGDLTTYGVAQIANECQISECSNTRLNELAVVITDNVGHSDFKAQTSEYLAWDMIHTHQCLDWILWVGDDYFHNQNNVVVVERLDGKFMLQPYSTDISLGQEWYQYTELYGWTSIPSGCQYDETCWADTISTCEGVIDAFQALQPTTIVDDVYNRLSTQGMLRSGDEERAVGIRSWMEQRSTEGVLEAELENYRADWAYDCDTGAVDTGPRDTGAVVRGGGGGFDTGFNPCG